MESPCRRDVQLRSLQPNYLVDDYAIVGDSKHGGNEKLIWRGPYSCCLDLAMTVDQGLKELRVYVRNEDGKAKGWTRARHFSISRTPLGGEAPCAILDFVVPIG